MEGLETRRKKTAYHFYWCRFFKKVVHSAICLHVISFENLPMDGCVQIREQLLKAGSALIHAPIHNFCTTLTLNNY